MAFIPAFIIGLGISWKAAFVIIGLYIAIQFTENNFLVPKIMSKALDLSPFLVFVVMLAGASLGGILGIILAVPIAGVARVIYGEYRKGNTPSTPHPIAVVPDIQTETLRKPRTKKSLPKDEN